MKKGETRDSCLLSYWKPSLGGAKCFWTINPTSKNKAVVIDENLHVAALDNTSHLKYVLLDN